MEILEKKEKEERREEMYRIYLIVGDQLGHISVLSVGSLI